QSRERAASMPKLHDFLLTIERNRPMVIHYELWSPCRPFVAAFAEEIERFSSGKWSTRQRFDVLGRHYPPVTVMGMMVPYRVVTREGKSLCAPMLEREMRYALPLGASELVSALGLAVNNRRMHFETGPVGAIGEADREVIETLAAARRGLVSGELLTRIEIDPRDPAVWRLPPSRFER
ncbi:MAG: hypothetical protein ACKO3W_07760, partial [bacterium]